ncbi:MAG: hypothetical protein RIS45_820, partial [Planctomycetota bacterium]
MTAAAAIGPFAARTDDFTPFTTARHWIGGTWCDPVSNRATQEILNPRYGRSMGEVL